MRKAKKRAFLTVILILALLVVPLGVFTAQADETVDICVTATTSTSVKQGYSGYCYVYIDSLEALSTLSVTVHYDADKVKVQGDYVYNVVSSLLSDKSAGESSVQFSYIFDGNGKAEKTKLFYFRYTVLSNAEVGDTYFDIVVNEAYDSSLQPVSVSGSRCQFTIAETVTSKTCNIYSSSSVNTSVAEEFELSYRLNTYQIASGSFIIDYDPELFEVVSVTNGSFFNNKIVDVNTKLAGSVYVSFVGTEYKSSYDLLKVKFKTLKNVTESSTIKLTVTEFYDLDLNPISCSGIATSVKIAFDETYTADAPSMSLQTAYNSTTDKVTLTIKLDKDSTLGAGDFALKFDADYLTYSSAEKGFAPTFFNFNDKNAADGVLKFSIISLSDITDAQTVLTVIFDVEPSCSDRVCDFEISGSGLTDSLTNSILLNFVGTSINVSLKHTPTVTVEENKVEPTCENEGSYDSVTYCSTCGAELSREHKTITKLGHDYGEVLYTWSNDYSTCTATRICANDSNHKETETVNSSVAVVQEKSCVLDELSTYSATFENSAFQKQVKENIKSADKSGHKNATAVEENRVEPTCEKDGSYDLVVYCSTCGEELSREHKIIAALGHDTVHHEGKAATCTADGYKAYDTCSRCDYTTYEVIEALGHKESAAVEEDRVEATCEDDGSYDLVVYCLTCGGELSREHKTITALGHDCVHHEGKAATCTADGYKAYDTCSRCDYTTYEVIEALGHKESAAVEEDRVEATCEDDGSYDLFVYCSTCGEELSREHKIIAALGHNTLGAIAHKDADCTNGGVVGGTYCTRCNEGKKVAETAIPALGHDEEHHDGKEATCTEKGWNAYVTCSRCDYSTYSEISALGHDEEHHDGKEATCTEKGWNAYVTCSRCDYTTYKEVPASGHSFGRWTCDKQATKDTEGHEYRECANCHAREERVVGKLAGGCIAMGASSMITVDFSLVFAMLFAAIKRRNR